MMKPEKAGVLSAAARSLSSGRTHASQSHEHCENERPLYYSWASFGLFSKKKKNTTHRRSTLIRHDKLTVRHLACYCSGYPRPVVGTECAKKGQ